MKSLLSLWRWVLAVALTSGYVCQAAEKLDFTDVTRAEFFPILPWNAHHKTYNKGTNGLESVADCHFNMAHFVQPKDLARCRKLGLGAIVVSDDPTFISFKDFRGKNVSDDEIEQRVKRIVKAGGSNPAIKGYFVIDEPGAKDFPMLAKAVAAFKKHAPGKIAYINLYPDYATIGAPDKSQLGAATYTEYLERFVTEVKPQFLSYDNYMVQMSQDLKDPAKFTSYYRNLLEVRRVAKKYNLPYLQIVSANQIRPHTTIPSPANLAFQAYTTLAAGYRGVGWFTYYEGGYHYGAIDKNGQRTLTWEYLQEINRQVATLAPVMSRLRSTGVYFTAPAPVADLPRLPGDFVQSVTCPEQLMVGEFKSDSGEVYVMVVNLSLERSAKFQIQPKANGASIEIVSAIDRSISPYDTKNGLWLVAGQGALLKLTPR